MSSLLSFVSSSKHPAKVRERAALASAALCCGVGRCDGVDGPSPPFPHAKKVVEGLLEASKVKELELHFHVGAALSTAALGAGSRLARDSWTVDFDALERASKEALVTANNLQFLVDKLTGRYLAHENKHVKQAAAVWTLALVQEAGGMSLVQGKMGKLQVTIDTCHSVRPSVRHVLRRIRATLVCSSLILRILNFLFAGQAVAPFV